VRGLLLIVGLNVYLSCWSMYLTTHACQSHISALAAEKSLRPSHLMNERRIVSSPTRGRLHFSRGILHMGGNFESR
jgi:hypothetical protein